MISTAHPVSPEDLMALVDGELAAEEAKSVSVHLEHCAECAKLVDDFRSVSRSLASWTVAAAPASIEGAVMREVESAPPSTASQGEKRQSPWNGRFWAIRVGGALAAVVILSLGLVSFVPTRGLLKATARPSSESHRALMNQLTVPEPPAPAPPPPKQVNFYDATAPSAVEDKLAESRSRVAPVASPGSSFGVAGAGANTPTAPMIARTVSLSIVVKDISAARAALDSILTHYQGYSAQLTVNTEQNSQRTVQASLRIPAPQLASALADLKALGHVETETQSGEEVTQQHADLVARLQNSRETEQRLRDILSQRTGKIDDVLQVEEEIARVRGEIEGMEAEQSALEHRVDFATIDLRLAEDYKAQFGPPSPSAGTQIRNSFVTGMRSALATILGILLFLEEAGPVLLIWLAILAVPGFLLWRRYRRIHAGV